MKRALMMIKVEMPVKTTADTKMGRSITILMHIESRQNRLKSFSVKQAQMMPKGLVFNYACRYHT